MVMFWHKPPWHEGRNKHRLGLRPVEMDDLWSNDADLLDNKRKQLAQNYPATVRTLVAYETVALPVPGVAPANEYPDWIANVGAVVADDLCLIDTRHENRFVAGCLAAPSYWSLADKLGKRLFAVHGEVQGMNRKIGRRIDEFFRRLPAHRPHRRENWFVHPERVYFRSDAAACSGLSRDLNDAYFRCEKQTFLRLNERFVLFIIGVHFAPLCELGAYPEARSQLTMALQQMDDDEIAHFGGVAKHARLSDYVALLGASATQG